MYQHHSMLNQMKVDQVKRVVCFDGLGRWPQSSRAAFAMCGIFVSGFHSTRNSGVLRYDEKKHDQIPVCPMIKAKNNLELQMVWLCTQEVTTKLAQGIAPRSLTLTSRLPATSAEDTNVGTLDTCPLDFWQMQLVGNEGMNLGIPLSKPHGKVYKDQSLLSTSTIFLPPEKNLTGCRTRHRHVCRSGKPPRLPRASGCTWHS